MAVKHMLNLVGDKLHTLPLLVLYLTDGCNSRCITCDIWRNPRRNMRAELVEQLASACGELRTRWVLLSGGEAMQHPHWPKIARQFRDEGVHVMLLTNGLLLRKQADDLVGNVDEVIVSLDGGTAATYDAIRGVDAFDLVLEGIRAVRERDIPVTTRTTVQRANFREIPAIIAAASSADVNSISFLAVDVSNEVAFGPRFTADEALRVVQPLTAPQSNMLSLDEIDALEAIINDLETRGGVDRLAESPTKLRRVLVDYFRALHGKNPFPRPRCNAPHFSTVVEVDGTVRPCYFLPSYGKVNGNGEVLPTVINNDAAVVLRQAYRAGQRAECERCVCPLYKGPRALLQL